MQIPMPYMVGFITENEGLWKEGGHQIDPPLVTEQAALWAPETKVAQPRLPPAQESFCLRTPPDGDAACVIDPPVEDVEFARQMTVERNGMEQIGGEDNAC